MKGLFLKDLALLKNQLRQVVIVILVAIFMMVFNEDITFPIIYSIMVFGMLGIGSISYDEFDNGNTFLFTLPITRKQYVLEKYLFMLATVAAGCVMALGVIIFHAIRKGEGIVASGNLEFAFGCVCGIIMFMAFLLPIELKFGPEKGRIAMIAFFAIIVATEFALKKMAERVDFTPVFEKLSSMTPQIGLEIIAVLGCVLLFISYNISWRIMDKKEF